MKMLLLIPVLLFTFLLNAQDLTGSWKLVKANEMPVTDKQIVRIYQDGYFAEAAKNAKTNEFLWTRGGTYSPVNYAELLDFDTQNKEAIGTTHDFELTFLDDGRAKFKKGPEEQIWERISGAKNELSGNWVITGRMRNGEMNTMTPGDRRTIKILGGDRFQWVAFNSATGEFFGTGGGTYTAQDGKYIENIDFFSRDNSRAGASLEFNYEVKDDQWHHSGKSSKGDPMQEIWSPYAQAYQKN